MGVLEMSELWRPVSGYEGHYEVSDLGRIRSLKSSTPKLLMQHAQSNGYMVVTLSMYGKWRPELVHRLVLSSFSGAPPEGYHGCHFDGDKSNNRLENLRWDSPKGNAGDMRRHGRHRNTQKTHCKRNHEFTPENTYVRPGGQRNCLECNRLAQRKGGKPGTRPKLDAAQVAELVTLRAEGWTYRALGDHFGVSEACVYGTFRRQDKAAA